MHLSQVSRCAGKLSLGLLSIWKIYSIRSKFADIAQNITQIVVDKYI